jgi:hypothetical protein
VTTASGLDLQPIARQAVAGALEIRDPARVRQLRRQAAVAVLRTTDRESTWEATADLLYLVQNPLIRNSYAPGDHQHPVEAAARDDLPAVLGIAARHDGPAGAALVEAWWRAHRAGFVVGRGPDGEVTAFSVVVALDEVDSGLAAADPVLAAFLDDVRRRRCRRVDRRCSTDGRWACVAASTLRPSSAPWLWTSSGATWRCALGWPGSTRR